MCLYFWSVSDDGKLSFDEFNAYFADGILTTEELQELFNSIDGRQNKWVYLFLWKLHYYYLFLFFLLDWNFKSATVYYSKFLNSVVFGSYTGAENWLTIFSLTAELMFSLSSHQLQDFSKNEPWISLLQIIVLTLELQWNTLAWGQLDKSSQIIVIQDI